jgi:hypothetical protein
VSAVGSASSGQLTRFADIPPSESPPVGAPEGAGGVGTLVAILPGTRTTPVSGRWREESPTETV